MQAERFRQIRNLFDAALERDQESRHDFLREACSGDESLLIEVGRLLAAHGEPTGWIDESVLGPAAPRLEGRRIGPYEVLRQLGEGGMGCVYLAVRADGAFRKQVALKIVRPAAGSDEVLRRFQREREILAELDHPNIARILDGGTTEDGLPYLVMDYVEGEPIDAYCDHRRLDLAARLRLFREVCAAVQYAHQRHVIHRDLKPSNILVTKDGVVKLLDFGIAKLGADELDGATALTHTGMCLMTPEYASPEQVTSGAVTPAADVYSLGVVLYELLTGRRPYRLRSRIIHEVVRVVCEEPPTRPSTAVAKKDAEEAQSSLEALSRLRAASSEDLKRQLRGDLDAILLKALHKDAVERYRSPQALSEDLRLHLEGAEVEALQGAWARSAGDFLRRNVWVLLAAVAVALSVYNRMIRVEPAISLSLLALFLLSVYGGARYIYGKAYVHSRLPGLAKTIAAGILVMTAVASILPRLTAGAETKRFFFYAPTPTVVFFFLALAAVNGYMFYRLLRWWTRERVLGTLLCDLSHPNLRFQFSPQGVWRALRSGLWYVAALSVFLLWAGALFVQFGKWRVGAVLLLFGMLLVLYGLLAEPLSRERALSRPSPLGPAFVILYLLMVTALIGDEGSRVVQSFGPIGVVCFYLAASWMLAPLLMSGRNEVRERGLAWGGRLIPWKDVLSHSWAQDGGLLEVLRLRVRQGVRSSRELRIPMLRPQRTAVNGFLNQQFAAWPSP